MKINRTTAGVVPPNATFGSVGKTLDRAAADALKLQPTDSGTTAPKSDSVQISDAGRTLSASGASGTGSLSAERVAELRKRVLEGAYNTTHVVDQVAKRILERGDV